MTPRESLQSIIDATPRNQLPDLIGELARAQALLALQLGTPEGNGSSPPRPPSNRYLTAKDVADMLTVSDKWVYEHASELGAVRLSSGAVRFSEMAINRYLAAKRV